jgi:hypothetical protein
VANLFRNEMHNDFGSWPIAYTPYGGADYGEIRAVAEAVGDRLAAHCEMGNRSLLNSRVLDWLDEQFDAKD